MSVLKSKRSIARTEFENTFSILYQYSLEQTTKIPRRRQKWLCSNINQKMNSLYRNVMQLNDAYFENKCDKANFILSVTDNCVSILNDLDKALIVLWNVQNYKEKSMITWANLIKKEVRLLNQMALEFNDVVSQPECEILTLNWDIIKNAAFLKNMSDLHRYTHGKVIGGNSAYDDTEGSFLISLVDDAFYELILANKKYPETLTEYKERRQHISNALTFLHNMNRPMLFYFNLMHYSNRIMNEWAELLSKELKLLAALQKSDKKRFSNLR